jgi:hypothetical protein
MTYYSNFIKVVVLRSLWITVNEWPTRAYRRASGVFSFFSFTSSPNEDKTLMIKKLRVKVNGRFCSPGEGKNGRNLHTYHSGFQVVKGEGEG